MIVKAFLQLIRWKNLLMITFIQILFKYVYFPVFSVDVALTDVDFIILTIATLTIAAAGYILNDVFDVKPDLVNKPNKVVIDKIISKKKAYYYYLVLNVVGIIAGLYVAYRINNLSFIAIFIITALLLRLYNTNFKKMPLVGNIIVSLLVS